MSFWTGWAGFGWMGAVYVAGHDSDVDEPELERQIYACLSLTLNQIVKQWRYAVGLG